MQVFTTLANVLVLLCYCGSTSASVYPRRDIQRGSGEVARNGIQPEPSCEELKAMWRLSKRQSRASELTNEIPTFQDPFAHNIWQPYSPTFRSIGGMRIRNGPIFGKMVRTAYSHDPTDRNGPLEELTQNYGRIAPGQPRTMLTAFRMPGGGNPRMGYPHRSGGFQHLKELIIKERARELHNQRVAEEDAARAEALKSLAHFGNQRASMYPDLYDMEDQTLPETEHYIGRPGLLHFPDLLAPSSRHDPVEQYIEDYGYPRIKPKSPDSLLSSSFAYTDYDGFYI